MAHTLCVIYYRVFYDIFSPFLIMCYYMEIYFFLFFTVNNNFFSHFCLQLKQWEFKISILACDILIDIRKSFNLVLHVVLLGFIQMNLLNYNILLDGCATI